jgi:hypothetical protein
MKTDWLGLGLVLVGLACASDPAKPPAGNIEAGVGVPTAGAAMPAAVSGAPALIPAGSGGAVNAGGAAVAPPPRAGSAGTTGSAGFAGGAQAGGMAAGAPAAAPAAGSGGASGASGLPPFSFFVTSLAGMQKLSKKQEGFGGDLRYGQSDGLSGADKICSDLAESSLPGAAAKGWRAFLSVAQSAAGGPVNAIDRIGEGPWYDRLGRVVAKTKAALLNTRPQGADPAIINDLPNEEGVPNQRPDPGQPAVNNHHFLTGSDTAGKLYRPANSTCADWTSTAQSAGRPRVGFSYPAGNRQHWISGQDEGGCGAGAVLVDRGGSDPSNPIVGSGGGYGGFYCFALMP